MNPAIDLSALSDDELLKLRFCDLGLHIRGTWLETRVNGLYGELEARGLAFRPQCYLSDEWLAPDNEPVVGIAFYLAHPRLMDLERRLMHDVEGGDADSCMKLLRHETGHAVNYAYQLYAQPRWKHLFGHFSEEYPDRYKFRPYSKSFVIHLDEWYAQYHPDEDFAETFAVWLAPGSDWRERYRGWKALEKLEYVDELMRGIAGLPPVKKSGRKHWNVSALKTTLRIHYKRKAEFYAESSPDFHDVHLRRIFPAPGDGDGRSAGLVLAKHRKAVLDYVAFWTGERKYIVARLMKTLLRRCRELGLRTGSDDASCALRLTAYVASLIMNYIYTGRYKRKP